MNATIVQPAWRNCPPQCRQMDVEKNGFRLLTRDEHARGLKNKQKVLRELERGLKGLGMNVVLYGSQVHSPEEGHDFDLMAFYSSHTTLKHLARFFRNPVPNFMRSMLESQYASVRFNFQIAGAPASMAVFHQPFFERVAEKDFTVDYVKIRRPHSKGPTHFRRARLFDGTNLWIPTNTVPIQINRKDYWLRYYYGWLYEQSFHFPSGLSCGAIERLVTSEMVMQERLGVEQLVEKAERVFATALAAYSRERKVLPEPYKVLARCERYPPEFKEIISTRIRRHAPTEAEIEAFVFPAEARLQAIALQTRAAHPQ